MKKTFHCEPQCIQKAPNKVHERITGDCLSTSRCYLLQQKGKQKHFLHRYSTLMQIMLTHVKWPGFLLLKRQEKVPFSNRGYIFDRVSFGWCFTQVDWFCPGKSWSWFRHVVVPMSYSLIALHCVKESSHAWSGHHARQVLLGLVLKWIRSNYVVDMRC